MFFVLADAGSFTESGLYHRFLSRDDARSVNVVAPIETGSDGERFHPTNSSRSYEGRYIEKRVH